MINTRFFCLPSRFLYLRPSMMAHTVIIKVSNETNTRCCQDIYPSAGREYPPNPKNSLILISFAWILRLYSSSHLLSFSYFTKLHYTRYIPTYNILQQILNKSSYKFSFFKASIGLSFLILLIEYIIVMNTTRNTLNTAIPIAIHGN